MKIKLIAAGLLSVAAALNGASAFAERKTKPTKPGTSGAEWIISCYRGPWETVAWDRPNAIFVDELIEFGYSPAQAMAIGRRVCRDEYGIGNEEYLKSTLARIIAEQPPQRRRK